MSIIISLILSFFSVFFTKIADFIRMVGDIFKRIDDLLAYKCMTRAELARCSGVSEGTIRNWKRTEPQACMLAKIIICRDEKSRSGQVTDFQNGFNRVLAKEYDLLFN